MPIIVVGKTFFKKNAFNKRIIHVYVLYIYVSETFRFAIKLLNMLLQEAQ